MLNIFDNSSSLELTAKEYYSIPDFIMMENAALALKNCIVPKIKNHTVYIFCGKGNNGADGYALARHLQNITEIFIVQIESPSSFEAKAQYQMCKNLSIPIISISTFFETSHQQNLIFVDCIYGTGFKGELNQSIKNLLTYLNEQNAIRIACDIPTAMSFKADCTVTMGELKLELFNDFSKDFCGKIIVGNIGINNLLFEKCGEPYTKLLEQTDVKLPFRNTPSANKGNFGHSVIFCGEKCGASILASYAALEFSGGLVSLYKTSVSNLNQYKISPELMVCDSIPEKTNSILLGPGLGTCNFDKLQTEFNEILQWFSLGNKKSIVVDADLFSYPLIFEFLSELNANAINKDKKIILTPHLKEFSSLLKILSKKNQKIKFYETKELTNLKTRIDAGKSITSIFPELTLVIKSANTTVIHKDESFICNMGGASLAKGGSGDILAGMILSLLAQGYSSVNAANTAVIAHALAGTKKGKNDFSLTPKKIINNFF